MRRRPQVLSFYVGRTLATGVSLKFMLKILVMTKQHAIVHRVLAALSTGLAFCLGPSWQFFVLAKSLQPFNRHTSQLVSCHSLSFSRVIIS